MCDTYRFHGHHVGDINRAYYRSKEEEAALADERDPIERHGAWLASRASPTTTSSTAVEARVAAEIQAGVEFALAAPYPNADEVDRACLRLAPPTPRSPPDARAHVR